MKTELFIFKMMALYKEHIETLDSMLEMRKDGTFKEFCENDVITKKWEHVFKLYDESIEIKPRDEEISCALHATCLWYIHTYIKPPQLEVVLMDDNGKQGINYGGISDYLIKKYTIITFSNMPHLFINGKYYEDKGRLEKDVVKLLKRADFSKKQKVEHIVKDIKYRIRKETSKFREYPFNTKSKYLIPVENGVIVRKNINNLYPKSPVWGFTYSLPVVFDPDANTDDIVKFITDLVDDSNERDILFQIPAHALLQNENYTQSYLFVGDGANGKSTLINLYTKLLGDHNTTSISLQELVEDKYKIAELHGKLMNLYADLPSTSAKSIGKFKVLTGGDDITVERKYCDPFKFKNKAVFVFSANILPKVSDATSAFWRRWAPIEFTKTFPVNVTFKDELLTNKNLSGFLKITMDYMDKIDERGDLFRPMGENKIEAMWKKRSNSAYYFLDENFVKDPSGYILKSDVYKNYLEFCEENDLTIVSKIKLTEEFEKKNIKSARKIVDKERAQVYLGLRRKINDDEFDPENINVDEDKDDKDEKTLEDFV